MRRLILADDDTHAHCDECDMSVSGVIRFADEWVCPDCLRSVLNSLLAALGTVTFGSATK